jgi:hypothetical protein
VTAIQPSSVAMLGQFSIALHELIESGAWDRDVELEVKIAGTLKNDKFIVIKPVKQKVVCNPNPDLKQQHPYQGETK